MAKARNLYDEMLVRCACGCGKLHEPSDARGRPKKYATRGCSFRMQAKQVKKFLARQRKRSPKARKKRDNIIRTMHLDGRTDREIAQVVSLSVQAIGKAAIRMGLERPGPSEKGKIAKVIEKVVKVFKQPKTPAQAESDYLQEMEDHPECWLNDEEFFVCRSAICKKFRTCKKRQYGLLRCKDLELTDFGKRWQRENEFRDPIDDPGVIVATLK